MFLVQNEDERNCKHDFRSNGMFRKNSSNWLAKSRIRLGDFDSEPYLSAKTFNFSHSTNTSSENRRFRPTTQNIDAFNFATDKSQILNSYRSDWLNTFHKVYFGFDMKVQYFMRETPSKVGFITNTHVRILLFHSINPSFQAQNLQNRKFVTFGPKIVH